MSDNPEFNGDKIRIRPSSIDTFFGCSWQWFSVYMGGEITIPGARAAIGTGIHSGAETMWTDAIKSGVKDANLTKLKDAAVQSFQEEDKKGLMYDNGEDKNTAEATVLQGVEAFVDDIVPFVDIPLYTEQRFTIPFDHPIVEDLSGTVDYISHDTLADVKTSKRKISPNGHTTQQSIYKMLAAANDHHVKFNVIQGIALLKTQANGHIIQMEPNIDRAKGLVNSMLDTLQVYNEGKIDPKILFRGNTKYMFCSPKYCSKYNTCHFTQGGK